MSWFKLKEPVGTNYRVDRTDLMNTKKALNQLGYYNIPPHRGIDDWTDEATFEGIKRFQKDNGLKVDAFMRPGGPTETKVNQQIAAGEPQFGGTDDEVDRSPRYTCTVCGAKHGGVFSPTICHNCILK
ncbi:peptidoglycan-binding domain-containing protein [Magnetospirillum aberrantis]|uniref:Peptidoglycan-binding protein n=1 Tax=Magnetospirillum aberrantis SpK TaxID=908842 RepID=A0A7C9QW24_9PROT|nr:peptidoglycan-binding domain-containing protein [Magnetospirillum aberrantis]NFV81882.1 peptidoglycan-binding protein [Magnetospirillum aberrantis SpK]